MVNYEIRDREVYREKEKVATFSPDGSVFMEPGMENYTLPVQERVRAWVETARSESSVTNAENGGETRPAAIRTVRQLIDAMQEYVSEPCPKMRPWLGDEDPAVKEWISKHDDVRLNVLRGAGKR